MTNEKISRGVRTFQASESSSLNTTQPISLQQHDTIFNHQQNSSGSAKDETYTSSQKSVIYRKIPQHIDETTNTSSSTEVYKMLTLHGNGRRRPAHIEFNLYKKPMVKPVRSFFGPFRKTSGLQKPSRSLQKSRSRCSIQFRKEGKATGTENLITKSKTKEKLRNDVDSNDRIDVYFFDQGNAQYLHTTDYPPHLLSDTLAQQTIDWATKFWAEIYGSIHIIVAFVIAFLLQTFRFLLYSFIRPLVIGMLQMISDYALKPLMTVIFNGLIQPPIRFLQNIFSAACEMIEPVVRLFGMFLKPIGDMLQNIRFVQIHKYERLSDRISV